MGEMREAWNRGQEYAQIHSTKDAIFRFFQFGTPAVVAWNLPIVWYWKIASFYAMLKIVTITVVSIRMRRDRLHSLHTADSDS